MFGRKKMYKKGLADAMQAYEAFGRKQEAALEHMREEVRKGNQQLEAALSDLGEDLNGIYNHLTSKEKAALYHLSTPMDIKDLEDEEKRLFLAVLYQLASDEGDGVTDSQRGYIRSVQKYLEITNPQTEAELSAVGDIDSLETQKALLQVVLEFLYLQDSDELSDEQEEFLGYFSVNRKQATLIEERVSRLFNAVGDMGIAEKYGYVPEGEEMEKQILKANDLEIEIIPDDDSIADLNLGEEETFPIIWGTSSGLDSTEGRLQRAINVATEIYGELGKNDLLLIRDAFIDQSRYDTRDERIVRSAKFLCTQYPQYFKLHKKSKELTKAVPLVEDDDTSAGVNLNLVSVMEENDDLEDVKKPLHNILSTSVFQNYIKKSKELTKAVPLVGDDDTSAGVDLNLVSVIQENDDHEDVKKPSKASVGKRPKTAIASSSPDT